MPVIVSEIIVYSCTTILIIVPNGSCVSLPVG